MLSGFVHILPLFWLFSCSCLAVAVFNFINHCLCILLLNIIILTLSCSDSYNRYISVHLFFCLDSVLDIILIIDPWLSQFLDQAQYAETVVFHLESPIFIVGREGIWDLRTLD